MNNAALTITNPLVLYRALVATNRISADPSQLRLALHLQKLYERLKDYEPTLEYKQRLNQVGKALKDQDGENSEALRSIGSRGIWTSLLEQKAKRDSVALTRVLNSHDAALQLSSPKGLMLHGEVGTGKSMLVDLFAECLPTTKKKRWHFNTFMLETYARLDELRRSHQNSCADTRSQSGNEQAMMRMARDLVETSPILFLDEFQLPDRASSKLMSNLMTNFFQLGGVLIATSNRMPDELAKAAGMEFVQPSYRFQSLGWRLGVGLRGSRVKGKGGMFAGEGEFGQFLDLLKARCDIWEMEGGRDYRRAEAEKKEEPIRDEVASGSVPVTGTTPNLGSGDTDDPSGEIASQEASGMPSHYFVQDTPSSVFLAPEVGEAQLRATNSVVFSAKEIPWRSFEMSVYGRTVLLPRTYKGVASFTFKEICATHLGPADYVSLASTFHTVFITDIPILTSLLKNEARRFITLLDALYEARCKLLISAAAGPDDIFFPETRLKSSSGGGGDTLDQDATYSETFSEMHQDLTAPFRPNVSSYMGDTKPDYTHARLQGILSDDALEDDPPNRVHPVEGLTKEEVHNVQRTPDFAQTVTFIGEDEKFAYKRAASRLWEMCGKRWWNRQEDGWWKPLSKEARRWETPAADQMEVLGDTSAASPPAEGTERMGEARGVDEKEDEVLFRHGASPFRTAAEAPPKIGWMHVWGTGVPWGKRAGNWGKGVEGLKDRKKDKEE